LTVGGDKLVKIWDYELSISGMGSSQTLVGHINRVNNIVISADNKRVFTSAGF